MRVLRFATVSLLVMLSGLAMLGQSPSTVAWAGKAEFPRASAGRDFVLERQVTEVQLRLSATDKLGRPIEDLKPSDLIVIQDRSAVAPIKSFSPVAHPVLHLGVLLDRSESNARGLKRQAASADALVSGLFRSGQDEAFVLAFSTHPEVVQPATSDLASVRRALGSLTEQRQLTSLYDSIVSACSVQFSSMKNSTEARRILLLFSDGMDNLSMHSLDDAVQAARAENVPIYAIAPQNGDPQGWSALQTLADRTGGQVAIIHKPQDVERLLAAVRPDERGEYILSFQPRTTRPGVHDVQLRSSTRPGLVLHTREHFFLQPEP